MFFVGRRWAGCFMKRYLAHPKSSKHILRRDLGVKIPPQKVLGGFSMPWQKQFVTHVFVYLPGLCRMDCHPSLPITPNHKKSCPQLMFKFILCILLLQIVISQMLHVGDIYLHFPLFIVAIVHLSCRFCFSRARQHKVTSATQISQLEFKAWKAMAEIPVFRRGEL